jgi:hypothetical protein
LRPPRIFIKNGYTSSFFVTQHDEFTEAIIALLEPIAVCIGCDSLPLLDARDTCKGGDFFQLFFAAEVVANIVEIYLPLRCSIGVFD